MIKKYFKISHPDSKTLYFFIGLILGMALLVIFGAFQTDGNKKNKNEEHLNNTNKFPQGYKIVSPFIPSELKFAGERVPLENFEVRERIDREFIINTYWHSYTLLSIKRANRWFPVIEPILKKNNIPDDFKYLAVIESGLGNVVSPAGATGFWQLIDASAKKYGLEVNNEVDERYSVEKSTQAACKYLLDAYDHFKSWTLAAAAYNIGVNGIDKQLNRQKTQNYYNLVLGEETSRYIARIVAVKEIFRSPHKYGFYINPKELYPPLKTYDVSVDSSITNLADFAISRGLNYKILKYYNPWLRDISLTAAKVKKNYTIKMPVKGSIEIIHE